MSFIIGKWMKKTEAPKPKSSSLEQLVLAAKQDMFLRNELIKQYQPFIAKVTAKVCKRYIDQQSDEFSVSLEAFNEAIDAFQMNQGSAFLSFAEMVIRRRVIDFIRREARQTRDIYLEQDNLDEENQLESLAQISASLAQYEVIQESEKRRDDISEYQKKLREFDITFTDLVGQCPKHIDARENAKQIAKQLASNPELTSHLLEKKQLPMKELLKYVKCSRKTVERNRKYIIAMALIYLGNYYSLRSYIEPEQDIYGKEG
ncbi:RNA polymerase sigma-I factor [Caldalkalibacillus mannanilyticus]|uniref:RNA polymerase sigma-I factor n=1 Tax=Caldalkalibacillus mannanilyticus TaxID=1418 RepID=UPI000A65778D|nr:RNA polymerase sigma-I factor [Caldalkalibacillus mannanilyticus]